MKLLLNKNNFLFIILTMLLVVLTACNKNKDMINGQGHSSDIVMEKIRVWSDNAHEKELRLRQIEVFNSTRGKELGIEIEYTVYGSDYQDVIRKAAQNGDAPELFRPTTTLIKDFVDEDFMMPLTQLPGGEEMVLKYEDKLLINHHIDFTTTLLTNRADNYQI